MSRNPKRVTVRLPVDVAEKLVKTMELVTEAFRPIREARVMIAEAIVGWRAGLLQVMDQMAPMLQAIAESIRALPEQTRGELKILGQHGWYLDLDMPLTDLRDIVRSLEKGTIDEAEKSLIHYYRERVNPIEEILVEIFPHRSKVIGQAFRAHKRKEYYLSVPVFLAQSDGICEELTGIQLFRKRRGGVPATAAHVESIKDEIPSSLLYPLAIPLPVSASEHERKNRPASLNRHSILHGESLDYGTEVCSLKSISLLYYVATILTWGSVA